MTRLFGALAALWIGAQPAGADPARLWELLRLDELIAIMAEEGRDYGDDLAVGLLPDGGGPIWRAEVRELYDVDRMVAEIRPRFESDLADVDTGPLVDFYGSEAGRRIVSLELDARRAFLDADVEAAATQRAEMLELDDPELYASIQDFIAANDLVEMNVAASMTFTYSFNLGLVDAGSSEIEITETEALEDVWAQEEELRSDTLRWLESQLSLSFAPLDPDTIDAYIALSRTDAGRALNTTLFTAFEPTLTRIAHDLGEGIARSASGRDI